MTSLLGWVLAVAAAGVPDVAPAVGVGDCSRALDLLAASDAPKSEARSLVAAFCHLRLGDAAAAHAALPAEDVALGPWSTLVRAQSLVTLGRSDEALGQLDGLTLPGQAGHDVRLLRGRLLAMKGDGKGRKDLEALVDTDRAPEARFWLAEASGIQGDMDAMLDGLRDVWVDGRPGGWDTRAAARLEELDHAVGGLETTDGRALARKRLERLHRHHRVTEALSLAKALSAIEPAADRKAKLALGQVHYAARDYEGALAAWGAVLGAPGEASGGPGELFDYALCHARNGDYDTAAVVYKRLVQAHPQSKQADFASFKLGYMEYDRNQCADAVPLFDAHLGRYPSGRHVDDALWFAARCHWRGGERDRAVERLRELERARPKSSLVVGAAYWQARAVGLAGDEAGQRRALQRVLDRWPTSGYAWFAAERLHTTFAPRPDVERPGWPESWASKGAVIRADALLSVGLDAWALDELRTLGTPEGTTSRLPLAWALVLAGDPRSAQKLACPSAPQAWRSGNTVAQQACTPRPEHTIVEQRAAPFGLPPAIAYGVMVAESALQPEVSSPAGARGLMQLMPEVGERLHGGLYADRAYDPDDLFLAPYNASLGTTELGERWTSLAGTLAPSSVPAVIASYNGGEEAVRRWLGDGPPPDFDEWSEDIGYTETRKYVKRVLGHVMAYRWVYGDPAE